ncbi:MAG: tryptophan 7-halogenase, partial [Bdellovibrionales bacterium]|nr:tryptophan 7-halogenase [Bdellovibrionales bacterium]
MQTGTFDVVVLGGGLSGLTLALQLKKERPGMAIAVLERRSFPVPEACFKVGESSVEIGAYYFSKVIGLEDHIREAQLPKFGLRYFFSHGDNKDITQRLEMGGNSFFPTPSYQLDRGRLENHLADRVRNQGITLFENSKVNSITLLEDLHQVCIEGQEKPLVCRWVVDASGRAGLLKHQNQLSESVSHQASSAWFRLNTKVNIDHWSEDQDWRHGHEGQYSRWFSTNHFMGQGYWVWIIPLSSGQTSIGIVADSGLHPLSTFNSKEKALDWLMQHEPQVGSEISSLSHLMTDFLAVKNFSHGAKEVFSPKRWCLTGEAGVFLDPFYSPGSDFIAVSNTFVTDLIVRFFDGEDIGQRARIYSQLYLSYFQNTLPVYEGQYKLFGNPDLMPLKVIWDYATYWTQLAFIFMQGYLCDLTVFNL